MKKKTKKPVTPKKLQLSKQTVRVLGADKLKDAAGGMTTWQTTTSRCDMGATC